MKKILFYSLLCFLFTNCAKETTLELNFVGNYDGATLLLDEVTDYNYYDGTPIKLTTLRFYITDITLVKDTEEQVLVDIADIDFTDNNKNAVDAQLGQSIMIEDFEAGSYDKIKFGIGITPTMNATIPTDYSSDHPLGLNNSGEYWDGWSSYIFAKVEGRQDHDEDNIYDGFTYHIGFDNLYQTKEISQPIVIKEKESNKIQFNIDAKKIFSNGTDRIDIVNTPVSHTNLDDPVALGNSATIMINLANSITIN